MVTLTGQDRQDLININRMNDMLALACDDQVIKMAAITRLNMRRCEAPTITQARVVQQIRLDRIERSQDKESWIAKLETYFVGDVIELSAVEVEESTMIALDYVIDEAGLLYFCPRSATKLDNRSELIRLVIPPCSSQLPYKAGKETSTRGRTYHRVRSHYHWREVYSGV